MVPRLSPTEARIVRFLAMHMHATGKQIRDITGIPTGSIYVSLGRLVQKGLAELDPDPPTAREKPYRATDEGRRVAEAMSAAAGALGPLEPGDHPPIGDLASAAGLAPEVLYLSHRVVGAPPLSRAGIVSEPRMNQPGLADLLDMVRAHIAHNEGRARTRLKKRSRRDDDEYFVGVYEGEIEGYHDAAAMLRETADQIRKGGDRTAILTRLVEELAERAAAEASKQQAGFERQAGVLSGRARAWEHAHGLTQIIPNALALWGESLGPESAR